MLGLETEPLEYMLIWHCLTYGVIVLSTIRQPLVVVMEMHLCMIDELALLAKLTCVFNLCVPSSS
jgi:hypothetical protein